MPEAILCVLLYPIRVTMEGEDPFPFRAPGHARPAPGGTMTVRAVVFDVESTLLLPRNASPIETAIEGLHRAHDVLVADGLDLPDFRTTFGLVHRELKRTAAGQVYGNYREVSLPGMVKAFLDQAFPDAPEAAVDRALEAWYEPLARQARPAPGARDTLETLHALGLRLAGAANSPWGGEWLERDLAEAGLAGLLDPVLGSADVGYRKPNLFLLQETLRRLGVKGVDAVHLGDDPRRDVEAPQEIGMRAWILGPPGCAPRADAVFCSLKDVTAALCEAHARA